MQLTSLQNIRNPMIAPKVDLLQKQYYNSDFLSHWFPSLSLISSGTSAFWYFMDDNFSHMTTSSKVFLIGLKSSVAEIKLGFKKAFSEPWPEKLRYQGDGRPFWRHVVAKATNCSSVEYFEEVYKHYSQGSAWKLPNGSYETLKDLRSSGVKLAVVSNFDNRLRPILEEKKVADLFNAIIISSEVGYEKPDPEIFQLALGQLGITASKAVHIGDDPKNDKMGANAIGIDSWLWGKEIHTFQEILDRIISFRKN